MAYHTHPQHPENKQLSSGTAEDREYADWLLKIGHGSLNNAEGMVKLDPSMKCGNNIESLIAAIYPSLNLIDPLANNNDSWFLDQTILCPRNDSVDNLNSICLRTLSGSTYTYHSADAAITDSDANGDFQ